MMQGRPFTGAAIAGAIPPAGIDRAGAGA